MSPTRSYAAQTGRTITKPPLSGSPIFRVSAKTRRSCSQVTTSRASTYDKLSVRTRTDWYPKLRAAFIEAAHQAAAVHAHSASARHYHAALLLTPEDDLQERAALLLGEASERYDGNDADAELLHAAAQAQIAAETWEPAAMAERMLSAWYDDHEARGAEAATHLANAIRYASRVPPSDATCRIAAVRRGG